MDVYELQFIETEQDAKIISSEVFAKLYGAEDKRQKELVVQMLNKINVNLNSHQSSPRSKYMTMLIFRDLIESSTKPETKFNKFFSTLLSHNLLKTMEAFCQSIDPNKQVQDKGKKYFNGESQIGHNFIRINLEIVKMLAAKFPKGKNEDATTFKKIFNKLSQEGVSFPTDYRFLTAVAGAKTARNDPMVDSKKQRTSQMPPEPPMASKHSNKQKDLAFLQSRIKALIEGLEDGDDEQYLQTEIMKVHELIMVDSDKFQRILADLLDTGENEQLTQKFLELQSFMAEQKEAFEQHINGQRNLKAYSDQIRRAGKGLFGVSTGYNTPGAPTPTSKIVKKGKDNQIQNRIREEEKPAKASAFNPVAMNTINQYFAEVQKKSKSPLATGFKKINQSLSREKAKNTTLRSRVSPHNRTNLSKSINSLRGSKIAAIFTNPPNPNPPQRFYQGNQISQNYAVEDIMKKIDKHQGHRRFCTANFKGKGSIFENQHIQIGFKSEAVYQQISGFRALLKIELYFGNLSQDTFRNLTLDFKGDQNILLYASPKQIERSAIKGEQNKIDLVIIPLKPQFPILTMNMKYEISGIERRHMVVLPNSVLKFVYFLQISKGQFLGMWQSASLFKTQQFDLSHYLPPDTLVRWIPSLVQLSPYSEFVVPGNKNDYELFTSIQLMQNYDALLRITVRPNLKVILQLGMDERHSDAMGYFVTFLQHMQQLMKHIK